MCQKVQSNNWIPDLLIWFYFIIISLFKNLLIFKILRIYELENSDSIEIESEVLEN